MCLCGITEMFSVIFAKVIRINPKYFYMKHLFLVSVAASVAMTCSAASLRPRSSVNLPAPYVERNLVGSKLVESRQLNADYALEVRELPNGAFCKTVRKSAVAPVCPGIVRKTEHMRSAGTVFAAAESQNTLYENFSGWDGSTLDWIPEGWSEINSTEEIKTLRDGRFTWGAIDPAGISSMPDAIDGKYVMCIYHASYKDDSGKSQDLPQDEWLITPQFTPKADEYLSFYLAYNPLYLFNCSNEYLDFSDSNNIKFKEKVPATTMKIQIREDGGEWVQLYDVYDDWKNGYDFQELLNNSRSSYWFYQFGLSDYVGKKVQVAFQFVGIMGNVMELDAVKVGVPVVEAAYSRPGGSFYWGFSEDYNLYSAVGYIPLLVPAYTDLLWPNRSSENSIGFQWEYDDPEGEYGDCLYSNDIDLTVSYPADCTYEEGTWFNVPRLDAYATPEKYESYTLDYPYMQVGGTTVAVDPDFGNKYEFGACNYNLNYGYTVFTDDNGTPLFGQSDATDQLWTSIMGGSIDVHLRSLGNLFEKPAHPYVISKVSVLGEGEIANDAKLTMTLKTVDAAGKIGDKALASATCSGADIIKTNIEGVSSLCIPFVFKDESGAVKEIVIDDAVIAILSGFDENVKKFAAYQTNEPDKYGENNAYVLFDLSYQGNVMYSDYPYALSQLYNGNGYTFLFNLDAAYPWMRCDYTIFDASGDGESKTFELNSYYTSDKWDVSIESGAESWLSFSTDNRSITFTAQPNHSASRAAKVTVSAPACTPVEFTVSQNKSSSIDNIGVDAGCSAVMADGLLMIQNDGTASSGKLYDVTGMLVREFALQNGLNSVDAQYLAKGVYVLTLDNGVKAKVLR